MQIDTLLMTPGPVQVSSEVMLAGARALSHHRTKDFAPIYAETVRLCKKFFKTEQRLFLTTSSGTGAMETAIANLFEEGETVLTIETGVFGVRFTTIAKAMRLNVKTIKCDDGKMVRLDQIAEALKQNPEIKAITVTFNETSTGIKNDIKAIGEFLKDKGVYLVVDGVSGVGALEFEMDKWHVDVAVAASQKGFLAPPGIGMVAVSQRAWEKIQKVQCRSLYFDLKAYEKNFDAPLPANPWTPAISVLYSLLEALKTIDSVGIESHFKHFAKLSGGLRAALKAMKLEIFTEPEAVSNVLTVFYCPPSISPADIVAELRNKYGILIARGQAEFAEKVLRITTIGNIGERDIVATVGLLEMILVKKAYLTETGVGMKALLKYFLENDS